MKLVRVRSHRPAHARPVPARLTARGALFVICAYAVVVGAGEIRLQAHVSSTTSVEIAPLPLGDGGADGAL